MTDKIYYCDECEAPFLKRTITPNGNKYHKIECDCEYNFRKVHGDYICDECGINEAFNESHKTDCGKNDTYH